MNSEEHQFGKVMLQTWLVSFVWLQHLDVGYSTRAS